MNFNPRDIEKIDDDALRIVWEDGHRSEYSFRYLRQNCPCAACRDEWSGQSLLDAEGVARDLKASRAEMVGNYALCFAFSDGHATGIFSFEVLRKLCPCAECGPHPGSRFN
ncbi:MAG: DUF971 domain-containing protein [Elusimicrobia bacterium]|nr:DUF971 domain-containing protein [Elusimicrobiota bacterium]